MLDRSSPRPVSVNKSASFIQSFLSNSGISDVWRFLHPSKKEYSFFSHVHHTFTRIDYFLIDDQLLPCARSCTYQGIVISDHAPVVLSLALPNLPQIKKHWRFNSSLLSDDEFIKFVKEHITFFFQTNDTPDISCLAVWDAFKAYLRGQIISFTANMRKKAMQEQLDLAKQIKEIDQKYSLVKDPDLYNKRVELQTKFNLASTYQIERQLLRSKSLFYIHGDKSGKLLANQLRGLRSKGHITKIQMEDGTTTSDHVKINNTFKNYYSKLYTSEFSNTSSMDNFLNGLNIPTLSTDNKMKLEEPITKEEIAAAILCLQSGKSPGPDGFPAEFFKAFSPLLTSHLSAVLSDSFKQGNLPTSFYEACITLIAKKDKDPTECSSYRPISLLNVDTKILAKVLARRLESILPSVISEDQTGFVKNRHSYFNIRRLFDILYSPSDGAPECILSLDAEKAFDRVEWAYLFATLKRFGFGPSFITWIKLLYSCPVASVRTNSQLSQTFTLSRGTRQGCPLSPLLFDLAIEPLAIAIRSCERTSGIWRYGVEHRVSLYADDLLCFISRPAISIPALLDLLNNFSQFSGYKLNLNKSELFVISEGSPAVGYSNFPFKIVENKFTYLGIAVTKKHMHLFKENFLTLLNHTRRCLSQWSPLSTSLAG